MAAYRSHKHWPWPLQVYKISLLVMAILFGLEIPEGYARGSRGGGSRSKFSSSSSSSLPQVSNFHSQQTQRRQTQIVPSRATYSQYPSQWNVYHQQPAQNPHLQSYPNYNGQRYPTRQYHQPAPQIPRHYPTQNQPLVVQHIVVPQISSRSGSNTMLAGGSGFVAGMAANSVINRVAMHHHIHSSSGGGVYYDSGLRYNSGRRNSPNDGSQIDQNGNGFRDMKNYWDTDPHHNPYAMNRTIWLSDAAFVENGTLFINQNLVRGIILANETGLLNINEFFNRSFPNIAVADCISTEYFNMATSLNDTTSFNQTNNISETSYHYNRIPFCNATVVGSIFSFNKTDSFASMGMNSTQAEDLLNLTQIVNTTIIE